MGFALSSLMLAPLFIWFAEQGAAGVDGFYRGEGSARPRFLGAALYEVVLCRAVATSFLFPRCHNFS
jgi:hypothetical protein